MRVAWLALVLAGCGASIPSAKQIGDCKACHPTQSNEFARSRHRDAAGSPAYLALKARAGSNAGLCERCHRPDAAAPGLTCLTCHTAVGNRETQNGQLLLDPDGAVQVGSAVGLRAPHRVAAGGFLRASELCATCHDVQGPGAFHEAPFESWQRSPAGQGGVSCQACHMSPTPGAPGTRPMIAVAAGMRDERPHASHAFVGLGAEPGAALGLLARGIELRLTRDGGAATLEIANVGEGHHDLAGAGFIRELQAVVEQLQPDGGARTLSKMPLDVSLTQGGAPTFSPLTADAWTDRGLDPEDVRALSVGDAGEGVLRGCLVYARVRPELSALLAIAPSPEVEGNCVTLPAR